MLNNKYFDQTSKELSKLIIGSLTFVSALAWNEAFKEYFSKSTYLQGKGLWFYAIVTSIFAIIIIICIKQVDKLFILLMIGFIIFGSYMYIQLDTPSETNTEDENDKQSQNREYEPSDYLDNYDKY